jgi:peptide/nickel transport system ATP-binding protein
MALITVEDLTIDFKTRSGSVHALERVELKVDTGEIVGIVGESGSGKSVTAFAIMGILDPAARILSGKVMFQDLDLLAASESRLGSLRGSDIAMIFQNPRGSLNPIRTVGDQIADVLKRHTDVSGKDVRKKVVEALAMVRIPDPQSRADAYPYELSGGMCQRIGIALAMSCSPKLLIADEPTTGLDVTTQAAIMDLTRELVRGGQMAMVLITHDLRLAAEYCNHVVVMHAGHVVEIAPTEELFSKPRHPYTASLIASTPSGDGKLENMHPIKGSIPDLRLDLPPCRFAARCPRQIDKCLQQPLPRISETRNAMVACWRPL